MTYMYTLFVFVGFLTTAIHAHMQMAEPFPFNSTFNPNTSEAHKWYYMTDPLKPDGSDFPCKGLQKFSVPFVAIYTPGSKQSMTVAGTAPHGGGSCQLSLSIDEGKTFKVIKSIIGGCTFEKLTYEFTVPPDVPQGTALFSWTWFNLIGNREMYQNCALVDIKGSTTSTSAVGGQSFNSLPEIFRANIGPASNCQTIENEQVIFPNPGSVIEFGAKLTEANLINPIQCSDNAGGAALVAQRPSTPALSAAQSAFPTTMATSYTSSTTASPKASSVPPGVFVDLGSSPSSSLAGTASSTRAASVSGATSPTLGPAFPGSTNTASSGGPCTPGQSRCDSATTWSRCVAGGIWMSMGTVAPGMTCTGAGESVRVSAFGECPTLGERMCEGDIWATCSDNGMWIPMGKMSGGMNCVGRKVVIG